MIHPRGSSLAPFRVYKMSSIPQYMSKSAVSYQPQLRTGCYHVSKAARLQVRRVSMNELLRDWVPHNPGKTLTMDETYYAECRLDGTVNWKETKIYTSLQLVPRNNVHVVRHKLAGNHQYVNNSHVT